MARENYITSTVAGSPLLDHRRNDKPAKLPANSGCWAFECRLPYLVATANRLSWQQTSGAEPEVCRVLMADSGRRGRKPFKVAADVRLLSGKDVDFAARE